MWRKWINSNEKGNGRVEIIWHENSTKFHRILDGESVSFVEAKEGLTLLKVKFFSALFIFKNNSTMKNNKIAFCLGKHIYSFVKKSVKFNFYLIFEGISVPRSVVVQCRRIAPLFADPSNRFHVDLRADQWVQLMKVHLKEKPIIVKKLLGSLAFPP